ITSRGGNRSRVFSRTPLHPTIPPPSAFRLPPSAYCPYSRQRPRQVVGRGDDDEQAVEAVEDAAVAGDDRAAVLDPGLALQQRLGEVAELAESAEGDADQRRPGEADRQPEGECAEERGDAAADQP